MDNYEKNNNEKKPSSKIVSFLKKITFGKIMKFIAVLLIVIVYVLLIGRMLLARNSGIMDRFVWTENSMNVYNNTSESFTLMSQQLSESIDEDGMYHISNFVYVPETGELQLTVRYNNSTLDKLNEYYTDIPDVGETFVFTLESADGTVYDSYSFAKSSNIIYNFRRLVFENVDIENAETLYLNVYYINDADDSAPMSVNFRLYNEDVAAHESDIKIKYSTKEPDALQNSPSFFHGN